MKRSAFLRRSRWPRAVPRPGWPQRVAELRARSGGICEVILPEGPRCTARAVDPHHVVARSKFGKKRRHLCDALENLADCCRAHHNHATREYLLGRLKFLLRSERGWYCRYAVASDKRAFLEVESQV